MQHKVKDVTTILELKLMQNKFALNKFLQNNEAKQKWFDHQLI